MADETRYALVHAYSIREHNNGMEEIENSINFVAELSYIESEELETDIRQVNSAASSLHIVRAVVANRDDLLEEFVNIGNTYLKAQGSYTISFDRGMAEISRKLLNLCASFRSYLEHQETHLKTELGRDSEGWINWRSFIGEVERKNRSYELIYGLRNYIQHVDMPPLAIELFADSPGEVSISVKLKKDKLLARGAQWSAQMRRYINSFDEGISLWRTLDEWNEAFQQIQIRGTELRIRPAGLSAKRILTLRERFGVPTGGQIGIALSPVGPIDGEMKLSLRWIDELAAEDLDELLTETSFC
ncbi:hypothetical protein K7H91_19715 [Martelella mediterranea]|uniref:hypothetical protein n=1 Tax=Martelella mediterranea TaxID=293089 RepID=UPI001E52AC94|nr:hypothetical protein [Martelella mediterranea]MCD1635991.1 hypothetical protein [Martelella mediterranea]